MAVWHSGTVQVGKRTGKARTARFAYLKGKPLRERKEWKPRRQVKKLSAYVRELARAHCAEAIVVVTNVMTNANRRWPPALPPPRPIARSWWRSAFQQMAPDGIQRGMGL
jgi:hypothetical protein